MQIITREKIGNKWYTEAEIKELRKKIVASYKEEKAIKDGEEMQFWTLMLPMKSLHLSVNEILDFINNEPVAGIRDEGTIKLNGFPSFEEERRIYKRIEWHLTECPDCTAIAKHVVAMSCFESSFREEDRVLTVFFNEERGQKGVERWGIIIKP